MKALGAAVAAGAAWMVVLRLLQRSLGLISTVVLARLLLPADFGLIAMALSISALVELVTTLGFDLALIRKQGADRDHFDSAWTLGLLFKSAAALAIVLFAHPVADFYGDPRLAAVMYGYALIALASGFENIGIVAFRKELEFNREFRFQLAKKLLSVIVTVALALYFRSYWALVLGTLFSQLAGVALSYAMHPYRPRFCLKKWRDLLGFSSWVLFNNFAIYARERGVDFVTGRLLGAPALGSYRVASEIAALPTTELYMPIMRVVFPGFSKIVSEPERLRRAYLAAQGAVMTATLPASVGVVLLAEPLVLLLLGPNWSAAVPLVQILGAYGGIKTLHGNRHSLFMALGRPYWVGLMVTLELAVMYPLLIYWLSTGHGIEMAAWAKVVAALVTLPVGVRLVSRVLVMSLGDFLASVWRPVLATAVMAVAVVAGTTMLPAAHGAWEALAVLLGLGAWGGGVYLGVLLLAWIAAGRPDGVEARVLESALGRRLIPGWMLRRLNP